MADEKPIAEDQKPAELPPVPTPAPQPAPTPDPTRYQDWEKGGRCIDF